MASEPRPLGEEDRAVLAGLAQRVVELRMEVPALLALESVRPLSFIAGQGMVFFEPFALALFRLPDYRRWSALAGRPEALEELARLIESGAEARAPRRGDSRPGPTGP